MSAYRRAEMEVAADTVIAVFNSGLLPRTAKVLAYLSQATHVPIADLRAAQTRWDRHAWRPPQREGIDPPAVEGGSGADRAPTAPGPARADTSPGRGRYQAVPVDSQPLRVARTNVERRLATQPAPDRRICKRCEKALDPTNFAVKNPRTGALRSWCNTCYRHYQAERYLSVKRADELSELRLAFGAMWGDPVVGMACRCGRTIAVGDQVVVEGAPRHAGCAPATKPRAARAGRA